MLIFHRADELDTTFELVTDVAEVDKLPERYRQLIEWATLWIAHLIQYVISPAIVFDETSSYFFDSAVFLNADSAKDNLGLFSRIHSMIPYGLCR